MPATVQNVEYFDMGILLLGSD